ncbi:MAG: amidohydrolase family protein [Xanthomonadales bacterium]|nr:amidohydrolase family protein [Xanthomonadales bacterium]
MYRKPLLKIRPKSLNIGRSLFLLLAFSATAYAERMHLSAAGILDVTNGEMLRDRVIVVEDGRIKAVSARSEVDPADADRVYDYPDQFIVPGFIDAHVHLHSDPTVHGYRRLGKSLPQKTLTGAINARTTLRAGVTTVRQVGSPGYADIALRDAINAGQLPGPRILTAGMSISITGGHCGDDNLSPFEKYDAPESVADGPWAMRQRVRQNVKYGADVIKTCSTGGVLSKGTELGAAQGTVEELTAIVEEAASFGLKVASHAHGATGIKNALKAGVASIEHASFIDDEGIRMARRNGTALVMDIYVTEYILGKGESAGILPESLEKERRTGKTQRANFTKAHKAGARIVFGTDAGVFPHGDNMKQLSRMVQFGMTPAEAIRSATLHGAELLGLAGEVGEITAGAYADLVILDDNPLDQISTTESPVAVFKEGRLVE